MMTTMMNHRIMGKAMLGMFKPLTKLEQIEKYGGNEHEHVFPVVCCVEQKEFHG